MIYIIYNIQQVFDEFNIYLKRILFWFEGRSQEKKGPRDWFGVDAARRTQGLGAVSVQGTEQVSSPAKRRPRAETNPHTVMSVLFCTNKQKTCFPLTLTAVHC